MSEVFLNQFETVKPKNRFPQDELLAWITKIHQSAESTQINSEKIADSTLEKLFQRYGVKAAQISQRYTESDDVLSASVSENKVYQISNVQPHGKNISERTQFFSDRAYEVMEKMYDVSSTKKRPDHLIHVTCTGYVSPSAAQRIVTTPQWQHSTEITHAYHMGCYAAMPAVRMAKSFVASESATNSDYSVDIIHNEMCSLHMNPLAQTPEQMVVQTLFADGHVKYSATPVVVTGGKNLKIIAMLEYVVPNSEKDMSWIPAPWGMQMNLSREVPAKIKLELKNFSAILFKKAGLSLAEALKSVFAIHPGGPKIIETVQEVLELNENQIRESKKILFERGNMSSATLPHVWSEILAANYPVGTRVISYAFGPGLTLFGSVFEIC